MGLFQLCLLITVVSFSKSSLGVTVRRCRAVTLAIWSKEVTAEKKQTMFFSINSQLFSILSGIFNLNQEIVCICSKHTDAGNNYYKCLNCFLGVRNKNLF